MIQLFNLYPIYRLLSMALYPLLPLLLRRRLKQGKENKESAQHRFASAMAARPPGKLIWIHAASNGESQACLGLVKLLAREHPEFKILFTSGTISSYILIKHELPDNALHQFSPWDNHGIASRFLNHWQPDLAIFMEQELWPNLIYGLCKRRIPSILINGRLSSNSYYQWRIIRKTARSLLQKFNRCYVQSPASITKFRHLGMGDVRYVGDLKTHIHPLGYDQQAYNTMKAQIGARPVWVAASTHAGEEEIIIEIAAQLHQTHPDLLTIIAPRHPDRSTQLQALLQQKNANFAVRSADTPLEPQHQFYICDSFGELGLVFALAKFSFIGGSLLDRIGGHNPMEAAAFHLPILMGPYQANCRDNAQKLAEIGGLFCFKTPEEGVKIALKLLNDPEHLEKVSADIAHYMAGLGIVAHDLITDLEDILRDIKASNNH